MAGRFAGGAYGQGAFRYTWYGRSVLAQINGAGERAANRVGQEAVGTAQAIAPRRTSLMADNVTYTVRQTGTGWAVVLFDPVYYTSYVVRGTTRMRARDFMTPAATQAFSHYGQYVKQELGT